MEPMSFFVADKLDQNNNLWILMQSFFTGLGLR
jgi:hypothetical protein